MQTPSTLTLFGEFVANAVVQPAARLAACDAVLDTVGVMLAGSIEPAARLVREVAQAEGGAARADREEVTRTQSAYTVCIRQGAPSNFKNS